MILWLLILPLNLIAQSTDSNTAKSYTLNDLSFLAGIWKIENKQKYETWSLLSDKSLTGNAHSEKDGEKKISEYFTIQIKEGKIVYSATVPKQNQGKTIDFTLNNSVINKFSFENLDHDFPKKIQYKKLDENTIWVEVLGNGDKGFSFKMLKQ
jgi:hypothetical protein